MAAEPVSSVLARPPPKRFGQGGSYQLLHELGHGACGRVFECRRDSSRYAVKAVNLRALRLRETAAKDIKRAEGEIQILRQLPPHRRIVQMIDAFEEDGWFFLALWNAHRFHPVVGFVEEFMDMAKPNMQELCRRVGVSRCTTSRNLYHFLLEKEALQGYTRMSSLKLSGVLEGDGTCLKLFKRAGSNFHVALWGLVQRPTSQEVPKMLVYIVPVKKTAHNAVCPVESREDILQTKALEQILPTVKGDREMASVLLTDGAKVYNKLAKAYGLQHKFVVHSKSEWSKTESAGSHGRLRVNTGLIDERWKCIKGYVPVSLSGGSRDDSETSFSPHLFNYLYSWWLRSQECRPAWSPHQLRAGAMHRAGIVAAEAAESDGVTSSDHALALSTSPEHMSEDNLVDFSDRSEESMEAAPVNVVASTSAGRDRSEENMEAAPVHVVASTGERQPPLSATLTAAAGRRRRAFKWGCHIHEKEILKNGTAVRRALCPHIFRSGRNQGQLWLLCSDWWRQRRCWHKESFDMSRFKELPTWQQDEFNDLTTALKRGAVP
ncbi:hypothetical protein AK812_SmicGene7931 [Symbiodinium microadriaticum]|uniref:Protein kinase domain-containing protein n=1 Tax=Symbiodinium microadriaticum TaxID=2951 RepID=A0A1Q9EM84_SYMMI|nr:hypothetical protein AK812_SmicGene7931 [Symbiodinium microadriaticum]